MINFLRRFKENEIQNKDDLLYSLRSRVCRASSCTTGCGAQWIRRGKLRAIKKQGRDWLIASIAEKPSRNYKTVRYEWDGMVREMYKEFPFLKGHNTVQISQNIEDKTIFDVLLDGHTGICLSAAECEKLELALLALADIAVCEFYDI